MWNRTTWATILFSSWIAATTVHAAEFRPLQAGAAKVDVTPQQFPVIMNGNFFPKNATGAADPLYARGLVLDDGTTKLAIVVVDACMMTRELIDAAKSLAAEATGIPTDRMLVSATHTHSSPSGMGCLGTPIDEEYAKFLRLQIAECIKLAAKRLVPARVGATSLDLWTHTHCRAWIRRPDRMLEDPFGVKNVRSNMHPGYQSPDVVAPVSPVDPEFSLLSVQTAEGKPLALLANYSMHYFGTRTPEVSSDYTGRWCRRMEEELGSQADAAMPFVAIFSQGTSGDSMWMDYSQPKSSTTLEEYTEGLVAPAMKSLPTIEHRRDAELAMAETKLKLKRRVPDEARLKWAREKLAAMGGRPPKDRTEVYAQEAIYLHEEPERELKLQAIRIGEFGIAAIPNEVFAISGLKIKRQSPLARTMNIELANGSEGYIPPPYQHPLGGYTTWPARTAALEVQAEPQIVETVVGLLEKVAAKPRREVVDEHGPYAKAVLESKPVAYWRLNEWEGPTAHDASGNGNHAKYVGDVAFYLPGSQVRDSAVSLPPRQPSAFSGLQINRAPHFAGGHLESDLPFLGPTYSVEFWCWNGGTNWQTLFSYGNSRQEDGDHLTLDAFIKNAADGELRGQVNFRHSQAPLGSATALASVEGIDEDLELRRWYQIVLVRDGNAITIYVNGRRASAAAANNLPPSVPRDARLRWGKHNREDSAHAGFEGRLDEISVYRRALSAEEIAEHYAAAKR
jgi:hypothetical protein